MKFSSMTSRERVHAAAKGQAVDRIPVMYWLNPHMACRMMATGWPAKNGRQNAQARLYWSLFPKSGAFTGSDIRRALPLRMNDYANSEYLLDLGADIAFPPANPAWYAQKMYFEKGRLRILDGFGSIRGLGGIYTDVIDPVIKSIKDMADFRMPDPADERQYDSIRRLRSRRPDACILVESFGVQDLPSTQLWKMDDFFLAMVDSPGPIKDFQRRFADWAIDCTLRGIRAGADIVFIYDDYGFTGRPLLSMKMWEEFTYPHLKRLIDAAHEAGGLVMLHSCGYQMPFLKYYVDASLVILQSLQPKAGNDFATALDQVGNSLAFSTGIDIQLGEMLSPEEMRRSMLTACELGKRTGKHILGMTHMLQYTMPEENTRMIFDTVREIQSGG